MFKHRTIPILLTIVVLLFSVIPVSGHGLTVTNLNNSGGGSLRQAILNANNSSGADTITFQVNGTITLNATLPQIRGTLTIDPGSRQITVSGNNRVRIFEVPSNANLTLRSLNLINGAAISGGAIANEGILMIERCTFENNQGHGWDEDRGSGGAITSYSGTLTVRNSRFVSNSSFFGGAIGGSNITIIDSTFSQNIGYYGSALYGSRITITNSTFINQEEASAILVDGDTSITNSTFYNNFAEVGQGHNVCGFVSVEWGTVTITNSTIYSNQNPQEIYCDTLETNEGSIILNGSILAGTCGGTMNFSGSSNVLTSVPCGDATGITGDPLLDALADNGGPTMTMGLLPGSPARDALTTTCPTTDQRGVSRPQGIACDIGAFEGSPLQLTMPTGVITTAYGNPTYTWHHIAGTVSYELAVFRDDDLITPVYYGVNLTAATYCSSGVCAIEPTTQPAPKESARLHNGNHTIYLRQADGVWAGPFKFTLSAPPPFPVTFGNVVNSNSLRPTANWTLDDGANFTSWFRIFLIQKDLFDNAIYTPASDGWISRTQACGSATSTTCSLQAGFDLQDNTNYYLFIQSYAPGGFSIDGHQYHNGWAGVEFRIDTIPDPSLPTGIYALPNQGHPTIYWTDGANTTRYHVVIYNWTSNAWVYDQWHNRVDACVGSQCSITPQPQLSLLNGSYSAFVGAEGPGGKSYGGPYNNGYNGPIDANNTNESADFVLNLPVPPLVQNLTASHNAGTFNASWTASAATSWYYVWSGTYGGAQTYYWEWHSAPSLGCANPGETCSIALPLNLGAGTYYVAVQSAGPGGWLTTSGMFNNGYQMSSEIVIP